MRAERLHVILDEADSQDCAETISSLHNLARGRVVVRPTPPVDAHSLTRDILRALGKRLELPDSPRTQVDVADLAGLWLAAERIRRLYVLRAHLLDRAAVQQILSIADASGIDTWLVAASSQPTHAISGAIAAAVSDDIDVRDFPELKLKRGPRPPVAAPARPWPPVPEAEFWFFRAQSRSLLSDDDFTRIDAELLTGQLAAQEWIESHSGTLHRARFRPAEVQAFVTGLMATATARTQAFALLRGAQCAFFLNGTLITLPATALPTSRPAGFAALDSLAVRLLRGFTSPRMAAAGALALACQLPPRHLCGLNLMDLGFDTTHANVRAQRFPIPLLARGLVRAQRVDRARDGAEPHQPLFCEPDGTSRISQARMHGTLKRISQATGLALLPERLLGEEQFGPKPWLSADAFTVTRLESLGQRELFA